MVATQANDEDEEDVVSKSDMAGCGVLGKRALDDTEEASFKKVAFKKPKVPSALKQVDCSTQLVCAAGFPQENEDRLRLTQWQTPSFHYQSCGYQRQHAQHAARLTRIWLASLQLACSTCTM